MDETTDANQKLRLECEKLEQEIAAFKLKLKNEQALKEQEGQPLFKAKQSIKEWFAIVATFIGIVGSVWALWKPMTEYFQRQHTAYETTISDQMLKFVDRIDSDSGNALSSAALSLSAYELDAVPFICNHFENSPDALNPTIATLKIISNKKSVDNNELISKVIDSGKLYAGWSVKHTTTKQEVFEGYLKILAALNDSAKTNQINGFYDLLQNKLPAGDRPAFEDVMKTTFIH